MQSNLVYPLFGYASLNWNRVNLQSAPFENISEDAIDAIGKLLKYLKILKTKFQRSPQVKEDLKI